MKKLIEMAGMVFVLAVGAQAGIIGGQTIGIDFGAIAPAASENFDAIWAVDGKSFTTIPAGGVGYGTLTGLSTDGSGNLAITVTKKQLHVIVAGLTLTAIPREATVILVR